MKYLIFIVSLALLISCDPTYCADYIIFNTTDKDLFIIFNSQQKVDTLFVNSNQRESVELLCGMSGGPDILDLSSEISIAILDSKSQSLLKTYFPNSSNKNIYDTENDKVWKLYKKRKRNFEFIFTIEENDLIIVDG